MLEATGLLPARATPARLKVLEAAAAGPQAPADLARAAGVSAGVGKSVVLRHRQGVHVGMQADGAG